MSDNRLTGSSSNRPLVKAPTELNQEQRRMWWINRGNRILWGQEADKDNNYQQPRPDLEWRCDGMGQYYITSRA